MSQKNSKIAQSGHTATDGNCLLDNIIFNLKETNDLRSKIKKKHYLFPSKKIWTVTRWDKNNWELLGFYLKTLAVKATLTTTSTALSTYLLRYNKLEIANLSTKMKRLKGWWWCHLLKLSKQQHFTSCIDGVIIFQISSPNSKL